MPSSPTETAKAELDAAIVKLYRSKPESFLFNLSEVLAASSCDEARSLAKTVSRAAADQGATSNATAAYLQQRRA